MYKSLKNNLTGGEAQFATTLEYCATTIGYSFTFECNGSCLFSAYSEDNAPIYQGDVCEVFIRTGDDERVYYEIEVAPNGTVFFAKIFNDGKEISAEFLEKSFTAEVTVLGNGYRVHILLPYASVGADLTTKAYFNAFRIETEGGIPEKNLMALCPTLCGSFHKPQFFTLFDED